MTPDTLKRIREKLNFTQKDLAAALQVHPNTVARWEAGMRAIDHVTAMAVAHLSCRPKRPRTSTISR
jgi:transcriptional regulator with XRE-family HTH domain